MKESTLATKIMIGILCLGVAAYLAIYIIRGWGGELATTRAYTYSIDVGQEAQGILGGLPVEGGVLWCCTELNTKAAMEKLIAVIGEVLGR